MVQKIKISKKCVNVNVSMLKNHIGILGFIMHAKSINNRRARFIQARDLDLCAQFTEF